MSKVYGVFGHKKLADSDKEYEDYETIANVLDQFDIIELCHGGGKGVESLACEYAQDNRIKETVIPPDLNNIGKVGMGGTKAQFVNRDLKIIHKCDEIIVFWDGSAPSTVEIIQRAVLLSKPVHVYSIK